MSGMRFGKLKKIFLFKHIPTSMEQMVPPAQTASGTLYQIRKLVENVANHPPLQCAMTYTVHDFIVITKHQITTILIFLNVYTYVLYSMESQALSTNFCHLCGK
jgi:hypothetical protein